MSHKSGKIAGMVEHLQGRDLDAHYLGYFDCFNRGLFYEAHDVLEELWLGQRGQPNHGFYQGLIQLAGAFVHLQKHTELRPRLRPAGALFKLAQRNLQPYPRVHEQLDVAAVLGLIAHWLRNLEEREYRTNPLNPLTAPKISLLIAG